MELYTGIFSYYSIVTNDCFGKCLLRRFFHTLIRPVNAFFCSHIILICQVTGKISRLEIHSLPTVKRFDGFHQIIRHFCRTVYRNIFKSNTSASVHHIITDLGIIVITVTPSTDLGCLITDLSVYIGIK